MLPRVQRQPWMTDESEIFRSEVRRVIARHFTPHLDAWRAQGYIPRTAWTHLAEVGALLPEIDERYGGAGASRAYQLIVQDELARAEVPGMSAVHSIAANYIRDYGSGEQKERWLPRLVTGELFAGLALTESGCGSDLKALRTAARRVESGYLVNGSKMFISNAFSGNCLVVAARTADTGSKGISLFVLETADLPGFTIGRRLKKLGGHAADTCEIFFENVSVPANHLLGAEEAQGFAQLMNQLPYERLLVATSAVAVTERAVELTIDYTAHRHAFGQPIAQLQNTRFKLAECATAAHIARVFVNDCIQRLIDGTLDHEAAYMAKWWCTEQQCRVTDECLQLFGGYGYMVDYPIARLYADARVQKIYGGTNEIMKDLIARKLFA
jgi:acyl-CoA dehydrogenase